VKDEKENIFIVKKKPKGWNKNLPDCTIVPPGHHRVSAVAFDDLLWENIPLPDR
jgi:hypothetical protein